MTAKTPSKFSRADYLAGKCSYRQYYAQFVNEGTRQLVRRCIGMKRLQESTDEHLNDIPLQMWDRLASQAPGSARFKDAGDTYTRAGGVCLLKEAAQQIIESERQPG